jgi:hypothetical protein
MGHDLYVEPRLGSCAPGSVIVELDGVPATSRHRVGGSAAWYSWDPVPKAPQTLKIWYPSEAPECDPASIAFQDEACYDAHPPCAL